MIKKFFRINLQIFADGASAGDGAGTTGATASVTEGASVAGKTEKKTNPLAAVVYGKTDEVPATEEPATEEPEVIKADPETEPEGEPQKLSFEDLIKGEYKKDFDDRIQDIIKRRFDDRKKSDEAVSKLAPVLEILGNKYGIDAKDISKLDIEKLSQTILADDSLYEQEAMEKGMEVSMLKEVKRMERENAELKKGMEERQKREQSERAWQQVLQQAETVKQVYPNFNIETEMRDPKFGRLVASGVDLQTAFEVTHKNELQPAAMQLVAQKTAQKVVNSIQANTRRPSENGVNTAQSTTISKSDPRNLTPADRAEIRRRVALGEKIKF